MRGVSKLWAGVMLAALVVVPAWAQPASPETRDRGPSAERERIGPGRDGRREPRWKPRHEMGPARLPIEMLFPPDPADQEPLREGEEEELLTFLEDELPELHKMVQRFGGRNPRVLTERLNQLAPRLRHLRRIYEYDPEVGRAVVKYTLNLRMIHETRRRSDRGLMDDEQRRLRARVRELLAENVAIETELLELFVERQEAEQGGVENRREVVGRQVRWLTAADADPRLLRPELQQLVVGYHAAESDEDRAERLSKLRDGLLRDMERTIEGPRHRLERLRQAPEEEIDRRLADVFDGERRGRGEGRERGEPRERGRRWRE